MPAAQSRGSGYPLLKACRQPPKQALARASVGRCSQAVLVWQPAALVIAAIPHANLLQNFNKKIIKKYFYFSKKSYICTRKTRWI